MLLSLYDYIRKDIINNNNNLSINQYEWEEMMRITSAEQDLLFPGKFMRSTKSDINLSPTIVYSPFWSRMVSTVSRRFRYRRSEDQPSLEIRAIDEEKPLRISGEMCWTLVLIYSSSRSPIRQIVNLMSYVIRNVVLLKEHSSYLQSRVSS